MELFLELFPATAGGFLEETELLFQLLNFLLKLLDFLLELFHLFERGFELLNLLFCGFNFLEEAEGLELELKLLFPEEGRMGG